MLVYCHFQSFLILYYTVYTTFHHIHYISQRSKVKIALELLDADSKPSADNNTCYSPLKSVTEYQIHKEGGVVNRFLTARQHFLTPWYEQTHCMSLFFLLRACEAHTLCARKTLWPHFTVFFTDFETKNRLFCSLLVL